MNTCEYKQETFKFKCNKSGTGHSIGISTPHHEAASSSSCGLSADNIDNESDELNIDEITGLYNKALYFKECIVPSISLQLWLNALLIAFRLRQFQRN
jgi:hypothetical protein